MKPSRQVTVRYQTKNESPITLLMSDDEKPRTSGRWLLLDKLGALGAFLAAAAAPCCFPLLAAVGAALGLGSLQSLRGYMDHAIQAMVLLALAGDFIAYRKHRQRLPLVVGITAAGVVFFAYYGYYHVALVYVGLLGLLVAAVGNMIAQRRCARCCAEGNS